jgi:hypothetical protein
MTACPGPGPGPALPGPLAQCMILMAQIIMTQCHDAPGPGRVSPQGPGPPHRGPAARGRPGAAACQPERLRPRATRLSQTRNRCLPGPVARPGQVCNPSLFQSISKSSYYYFTIIPISFCKIIEIIAKQSQHYFSLFYYYSVIILHYPTIIFTIIILLLLLLFYSSF